MQIVDVAYVMKTSAMIRRESWQDAENVGLTASALKCMATPCMHKFAEYAYAVR